ncbi:unnamed protein product [Boreogadus saida]
MGADPGPEAQLSIAKILWTSGRVPPADDGGNSAAAQLREYNPFLCRTAAELPPPELLPKHRRQSGGGDMEEKGIVLPELSCRTAAELPLPDFSAPGGHPPEKPGKLRWQFSSQSTPPELPDCHRSFCGGRTASAAVRREELGGIPAAQLPEYNPFLLHVTVHGFQRNKAKVTFPKFFSTMAEISPTTSLYLLWKCQRSQTSGVTSW